MDNSDQHLQVKIGQYVIISNEENKILLLRRTKSKNWSLPGGRLEKNDRDWEEAIVREVKEETAIIISDLKPFDIKLIEDPYQIKYCVYFIAQGVDISRVKISEEHDLSRWLGKEELEDLVIDDEPNVRQVLEHFLRHNDVIHE